MKPPWYGAAEQYIGLSEIAGTKHNPAIVRMWQMTMLPFKDDETPWCAGFVGSCLEEVGIRSTRSGLAMSYATYGVKCNPTLGAIAYMERRNAQGKRVGGHVGFVAGTRSDGKIMLLGGNQGNKVSIAPFDKQRIMGYRWPNNYPMPARPLLPKFKDDGTPVSKNEA